MSNQKYNENGILSKILTSKGYITLSGTTPCYHYYLKDHQGNNWVLITQSDSVEQVNHYYPFGGLFGEGVDLSKQSHQYNGKELDRMHGLNWYDYGGRMKDDWGFTTVDPLCEKYYGVSPYAYCFNNPIRYIDPDGQNGFDIVLGFFHSVASNLSLGVAPVNTSTVSDASDYNTGLNIGDVVSLVMGAFETTEGVSGAVGGAVATVASGGTTSVVSIPGKAAGVVTAVHGAGHSNCI